jgi:hypothetical protein
VASSGKLSGTALRLSFTRPLLRSTVARDAFTVTALRAAGWSAVEVVDAALDDAGTTVVVRLKSAPRARPLRVVASGAGPTPLLGTDGRPLSGTDVDRRTVSSGEDAALHIADEPTPAADPAPDTDTDTE